jgi:hypothetical protein
MAAMAVFHVPSTSLSRPLQFGFQVQSDKNILIQDFRAQRHQFSVVVGARCSKVRVRGLGKASRALAESSVAASLAADEPVQESDNGMEEMDLETKDVYEVELSEEARENGVISPAALQREVSRRRNFAIISHPDAGKTTLVNLQFKIDAVGRGQTPRFSFVTCKFDCAV